MAMAAIGIVTAAIGYSRNKEGKDSAGSASDIATGITVVLVSIRGRRYILRNDI